MSTLPVDISASRARRRSSFFICRPSSAWTNKTTFNLSLPTRCNLAQK